MVSSFHPKSFFSAFFIFFMVKHSALLMDCHVLFRADTKDDMLGMLSTSQFGLVELAAFLFYRVFTS